MWWSLKRIQLKLEFSIFKRRSTLTSKYETWKVLTCTDSRLEHFTVDHKDQVWRKIFARDSIEKPFREREYHRSQRREGRVFAADSRDYRYTSPLVHIFLRFHAYSVNSTSWPHKSTTQWRVARESIFIVAKCIKLRYRQSLSYSCTRACTRARARLQSTFVARFPYVCACVCVYVRCAVCTRCGQLTLNVSTWTGWIMGLSINLIAINTYEKRAKERPKCVCNPCVYPHSCIS